MRVRSHVPPAGRWGDLEQLLWESEPPSLGPFHGVFKRWGESMRARNIKERVLALLIVFWDYNPTVLTNPSRLQSTVKHLKDEMDAAEAERRAALEAERLRQEARQRENLRQETALGALPRGYGVDAPRVDGVVGERQRRDQGACDLLAQNHLSRNTHSFRPIVVREVPRLGEAGRPVVTPVPALAVVANDGGQVVGQLAAPPQLPTLDKFAAMPVPPPLNLPAAPGQVGAANNAARARAHATHRFLANAATAGVGQPFVINEADAAAMRRPRRIDNMDGIDGLNRAMNDT
jgi:hypothetical protein